MAATRIYTTTDGTGKKRLVRASTSTGARSHAARDSIEMHVATADELIELTKTGVEVEDATASAAD